MFAIFFVILQASINSRLHSHHAGVPREPCQATCRTSLPTVMTQPNIDFLLDEAVALLMQLIALPSTSRDEGQQPTPCSIGWKNVAYAPSASATTSSLSVPAMTPPARHCFSTPTSTLSALSRHGHATLMPRCLRATACMAWAATTAAADW